MKTQFYPITIICILILVCSSCSITRQTTCPTFANKTEKIHKPLFSKNKSSKKKKKQCVKISDQTKKEKTKKNKFAQIENIISKIEMNDITASSGNDVTLNSTDLAPLFIESKIQKILYKKIEKKSKKLIGALEKHNQKKDVKENSEQIISKKKYKRKHKKLDDDPTDELETHDFAIMSLISGIAVYITPFFFSLIGGWFLLPAILFAILAICWGKIGRRKIQEDSTKYKGEGMALTGLILGIVALGVLITLLAFILLLVASLNGSF